jgi:PAS domain S-box-containing protein
MKVFSAILAVVAAAVVFILDHTLPYPTPSGLIFEPPLLLPVLNVAFLCLSFFFVAYVASRGYLTNGTVSLLLMGCGALAFGSASLLAGGLRGLPGGANLTVTLHNTGAALGGLLHFASAVPLSLRAGSAPGRRRTILSAAYLGILLIMAALTTASLEGALPTFLDPVAGPTPVRQTVLGAAVALFALAALLLFLRHAQSGSSFLYWYAMGLVFISLGLMTILWYRAMGDPITWAGRIAQYLGSIYLFMSVWLSFKTARAEKVPVQSVLAEIFKEPREFHAAIVETVTDAIISIDREGRVLLWNRAAERMFGYTLEEATGSDLVGLISPETCAGGLSAHFARPVSEQKEEPARPGTELVLKRKTGAVFPAEMTVSGTLVSGQWIGTFVFRDVTLRKRAEEELKEREKENRQLAQENAIVAEIGRIIGSTLVIDEVYERFSKEVRKLIPFDRIGISIIDVEKGTAVLSYVDGQTVSDREVGAPYPLEGTAVAELIRTKSAVLIQADDPNEVRTRFPGLLSTCQAGFRSILTAPLIAKGEIIGALLLRSVQAHAYSPRDLQLAERVGRQIAGAIVNSGLYAEHVKAEQIMKRHLERLGILLAVSHDVLSAANPEDLLRTVTGVARDITGAKLAVAGHGYKDGVFHLGNSSRAPGMPSCLSGHVCSGERGGVYLEIMNKAGTIRYAENELREHAAWWGLPEGHVPLRGLLGAPLVDRNGKAMGMIMVSDRRKGNFTEADEILLGQLAAMASLSLQHLDLMDALRASKDGLEKKVQERTQELARRNEELRSFSFIASHDLQEPLRKILSFGELLADGSDSLSVEGRDYIGRMRKAAARMQNLIDALLSYSRVNTKAQPFSPVDLGKAAQEAMSNLEIRMQETGGRVEAGDLPVLVADENQMIQLFQNLIANALKFARKGEPPWVKVFAREVEETPVRAGAWEILVEDRGIGFDEKYLDRIFNPFERLHGKSEYPGAGMGLAICRKIAERHGGGITARSTPGEGSTFIVTLPARPPAGEGG